MHNYQELSKNIDKIYSQIIDSNKTNDGLIVYANFYNNVIKSFENYDHYEKCFEIINPTFEKYLNKFLKFDNSKFNFFDENKINVCFYLPNIANSLAHIDFLHNTLNEFHSSNYNLYIATNKNVSKIISNKIQDLINKKIIKEIIHIDILSIKDIKRFSYKYKNFFDKFVVWALPLIIPLWTKIFSDKVIYVSLKFKYGSFRNLLNGIYFSLKKNNEDYKLKNTNWKKVETELINFDFIEHTKEFNKDKIKLITINRIEKIRNEFFLDTVCKILNKIPSANFFYTGRTNDLFVSNYFKLNNLEHRVSFLGWINPNEIINDYDIFLDVPYLSGILAANFFISGMPVVTFDETTSSYIDMIKNELYNRYKMKFTFRSKKEYIDYVIKLATNKKFFNKIRINQINSKYLFKKNNLNLTQSFFRAIDE